MCGLENIWGGVSLQPIGVSFTGAIHPAKEHEKNQYILPKWP